MHCGARGDQAEKAPPGAGTRGQSVAQGPVARRWLALERAVSLQGRAELSTVQSGKRRMGAWNRTLRTASAEMRHLKLRGDKDDSG